LTFRPTVVNRDILTLDVTDLMKALPKCSQPVALFVRECDAEKSDHRHRRLLRTRSERPRSRHTTERCNKVAPPHVLPSTEDPPYHTMVGNDELCITAKLAREWRYGSEGT
jgi:hypothetical protein